MMFCQLCEQWSMSAALAREIIGRVETDGQVEEFKVKVRLCDPCANELNEEEE